MSTWLTRAVRDLEMCIACPCGIVRKLTGQLGQVYDKPIKAYSATRQHSMSVDDEYHIAEAELYSTARRWTVARIP